MSQSMRRLSRWGSTFLAMALVPGCATKSPQEAAAIQKESTAAVAAQAAPKSKPAERLQQPDVALAVPVAKTPEKVAEAKPAAEPEAPEDDEASGVEGGVEGGVVGGVVGGVLGGTLGASVSSGDARRYAPPPPPPAPSMAYRAKPAKKAMMQPQVMPLNGAPSTPPATESQNSEVEDGVTTQHGNTFEAHAANPFTATQRGRALHLRGGRGHRLLLAGAPLPDAGHPAPARGRARGGVRQLLQVPLRPAGEGRLHACTSRARPPRSAPGRHFLRVGVQGKVVSRSQRKPAHLVFLVDTSGSMQSADKLPLAQEAMKIAVKNLNENDTVALVTYAGSTQDVLPPTPATDRSASTRPSTRCSPAAARPWARAWRWPTGTR